MKMYKLAIVLTIVTLLGGCGHMLVPGWAGMTPAQRQYHAQKIGAAFEKGFNRGMSRGLTRSRVRYGSFKSKVRLSDGRVLRSKTKYRTGGWRKTKISTKYY